MAASRQTTAQVHQPQSRPAHVGQYQAISFYSDYQEITLTEKGNIKMNQNNYPESKGQRNLFFILLFINFGLGYSVWMLWNDSKVEKQIRATNDIQSIEIYPTMLKHRHVYKSGEYLDFYTNENDKYWYSGSGRYISKIVKSNYEGKKIEITIQESNRSNRQVYGFVLPDGSGVDYRKTLTHLIKGNDQIVIIMTIITGGFALWAITALYKWLF
ncbi:MAG TPA: hypothetical protein VHO70_14210 [Chitinispirillaceae bacterium]|nr:hypothetical protein [Chitinispirillaceae bacterium]